MELAINTTYARTKAAAKGMFTLEPEWNEELLPPCQKWHIMV